MALSRPSSANGPKVREKTGPGHAIEAQCGSDAVVAPGCRRFPLRVVLNEFAAKMATPGEEQVTSLLSWLVKKINRVTDREITTDDFRLWLKHYPWVLVLDELDEVPASTNRKEVLSAISDFLVDVHQYNADILIIATSRPQGYNREFAPSLYNHRFLTPLSPTIALTYARRLSHARYGHE